MKCTLVILTVLLMSCGGKTTVEKQKGLPIVGTWKLISGTTIQKGDTTITNYTKNISFIKIINDTHFAFLRHDLAKGKDSSATFDAGGGTYSLSGNQYTEHLEYCSARQWENNNFTFSVKIENDTLTQSGIEKVDNAGVNRLNIEKYVRAGK